MPPIAYRLKKSDKSVEAAMRRIGSEQIGKAVASIENSAMPLAAKIHDVRKRCKKLRGLIRLVRPGFSDYANENRAFRDIAGLLSSLRDDKVMADTYDFVADRYDDQIDRQQTGIIRRRFTLESNAAVESSDADALLADCRDRLQAAARRAEQWSLEKDGW